MNKPLLGSLMILFSALGFGSYGVWAKFIGPEFGIFFQGWVRSAIVLVVLIPIAFLTKSWKPLVAADRKWVFITVLFGVFTQVPIYYAYTHMDIGTTNLIFFATVAITSYIIGMLFLGEQITWIKIIALVLAFLGLITIFGFSLAKFSLVAMLLAALNGIASGGEVSTTKKSTEKYSSLQVGMYVWGGIFITHLPLSILLGEKQIPFAFNFVWLSMIGFAAAGLIAFWLVIEGYRYVDASIGGLIGLMEIIFTIIFGVIVFHEQITTSVVIGGFSILLAAMLPDIVNIFSKKNKRIAVLQTPIIE